jgi:hypothetical protein
LPQNTVFLKKKKKERKKKINVSVSPTKALLSCWAASFSEH